MCIKSFAHFLVILPLLDKIGTEKAHTFWWFLKNMIFNQKSNNLTIDFLWNSLPKNVNLLILSLTGFQVMTQADFTRSYKIVRVPPSLTLGTWDLSSARRESVAGRHGGPGFEPRL